MRGTARRDPSFLNYLTDDANSATRSLDALHEEISKCRVCETIAADFKKPPYLNRGELGRIMIVGQGPGRAELKGTRAFAGQSGRTLDAWLVKCGASRTAPRTGIYFTSVIKCIGANRDFEFMAAKCIGFLHRQILTARPELVITLGRRSFEALKVSSANYEAALCKLVNTTQTLLVTPFDFHYSLLHWPHPSGRNRWLNLAENKKRLEQSFLYVNRFLGGPQ